RSRTDTAPYPSCTNASHADLINAARVERAFSDPELASMTVAMRGSALSGGVAVRDAIDSGGPTRDLTRRLLPHLLDARREALGLPVLHEFLAAQVVDRTVQVNEELAARGDQARQRRRVRSAQRERALGHRVEWFVEVVGKVGVLHEHFGGGGGF